MAEAIVPELLLGQITANTVTAGGMGRIMFDPPIRCKYGLSACLSGDVDGNAAVTSDVYIYYRLIGQETDGKRER
jgi:hypothetical protein